MTRIWSKAVPLPLVIFVILAIGVGTYFGALQNAKKKYDAKQHCPIISLQKATQLTHMPISETVDRNHCVFVDNGGRVWLTITWYDDPKGWSFEHNAGLDDTATDCKAVEALPLKQTCWIPEDHGIMLRKNGKLVIVLAARSYNNEDLVDMASGVANAL